MASGDAASCGLRVFASGTIWLGVASLITFFLAYILVLSWADYSYVQPASSFSYAVVALFGIFLVRRVDFTLALGGDRRHLHGRFRCRQNQPAELSAKPLANCSPRASGA